MLNILINIIGVLVASYILPGIHAADFLTVLVAAIVLGVLNGVLRPILLFLTLPLNILTLGLLTFIINALIVMLAAYIVPGFVVDSFWWALLFSLVLSILNIYLHWSTLSLWL